MTRGLKKAQKQKTRPGPKGLDPVHKRNKKTPHKESEGLFKSLLARLENQFSKIQERVRNSEITSTFLENRLENRQKSRLAVSKNAPTEAKHWEKTPSRRVAGFQGAQTRRKQGLKDHKKDDRKNESIEIKN